MATEIDTILSKLGWRSTDLAARLSLSAGYVADLRSGRRKLTPPIAIRLFRETGEKIGPIASATDEEISVLERFERDRAA